MRFFLVPQAAMIPSSTSHKHPNRASHPGAKPQATTPDGFSAPTTRSNDERVPVSSTSTDPLPDHSTGQTEITVDELQRAITPITIRQDTPDQSIPARRRILGTITISCGLGIERFERSMASYSGQ
jgi:hypothetical protein